MVAQGARTPHVQIIQGGFGLIGDLLFANSILNSLPLLLVAAKSRTLNSAAAINDFK